MSLRLIGIDARRNAALWLCPVMVALSALMQYSPRWSWLEARLLLWTEAGKMMHDAIYIMAPMIAGAAAWMGARERRRKLDDLLATTPRPVWARQTATWAATTLWAVLAYVVVGLVVGLLTLAHAVWGGPVWWPMLVGLLALPACAAIGHALGAALPGRFIAPVAAIAVFVLLFVGQAAVAPTAARPAQALSYLSPVAFLNWSVWYGARPDVGLPQALFLFGVTGLALSVPALRARRDRASSGMALAGLLLVGAGTAGLLSSAPPTAFSYVLTQRSATPIPYTPACVAAPVPVCAHPAYRPWLARDAAVIARIMAPLRGVQGAPTRAEERPNGATGEDLQNVAGGVLRFTPTNEPTDQFFFGGIAFYLVQGDVDFLRRGVPPCPGDPIGQSCIATPDALGIYLLRQAGLRLTRVSFGGGPPIYLYFGGNWAGASAAADRFAALPAARRRAWLQAHYRAVTELRVPLKDMP